MVGAGFAQKLGMTHIYVDNRHVPVTVLKVAEQVVTSIVSSEEKRIQIGAVTRKHVAKPQQKELSLKSIELPISKRRETLISDTEAKIGDSITVAEFTVGDQLIITGTSKGKGFSGVIKRHGWSRGPMSHGSKHHRAPGSIGSGYPQRVVAGKKLPGHKGSETVTVRGNKVMAINTDNNTMAVSGVVPGANRSYVFIKRTGKPV